MLIQAKQFYPVVKMDTVKVLKPGEDIRRNLVFIVPEKEVPDGFIWKNVGSLKIPQAPAKKHTEKSG